MWVQEGKLVIFNSVLVPILTYGDECWAKTKRVRSRIRKAEILFHQRASGVMLLDEMLSLRWEIFSSLSRYFFGLSCPNSSTMDMWMECRKTELWQWFLEPNQPTRDLRIDQQRNGWIINIVLIGRARESNQNV